MKYLHENSLWLNKYEEYLIKGKKLKMASVAAAISSIDIFLKQFTKSLRNFKDSDAIKFLDSMLKYNNDGICISKPVIHSNCKDVKAFFEWLKKQPGLKRKLSHIDLVYFDLSGQVLAEIKTPPKLQYPSFREVKALVNSIPTNTNIGLRDRALISFTFLCGSRIMAMLTTTIGDINFDEKYVTQFPSKGAKTKLSKQLILKMHDLDEELFENIKVWVEVLRGMGFEDKDPLFPKLKRHRGQYLAFSKSIEFEKSFYKSHTPITEALKKWSQLAGLKYYSTNDLRHGLWKIIQKSCGKDIELLIACSILFSHDFLKTSIQSYGRMSHDEALDKVEGLKLKTDG
ncbi:MAG: tyrosine-type recombinase/integrase [Melioribacteraceae bacterium]|nr:tyrosine-type recombinase/integrase [Melioribacteraceae bacterium]